MIAFHPFADLFDMIQGSDFDALVGDVRRNGIRERIRILDGKILDGRNRYMAAIAAGLIDQDDEAEDRPMLFEKFVPDVDGDPLSFVLSKNIYRRHLTVAQRAYAMAECERFRHGGQRKNAPHQDANLRLETRAEMADRAHVSERSIASAAVVRDHGSDELKAAVRQGAVPISRAEEIARLPAEEQPKHLPNGARAIMGSRVEAADSLDYSPTPPYATRALMERVLPNLGIVSLGNAWEPACGEGHIAEILPEYGANVFASDIAQYGYGTFGMDFLAEENPYPKWLPPADWIITNPPFGDKAEQFALRALERAKVGVAIFARLQWLETIGRYERLFRDQPPTLISFFCERVALCMGQWNPEGGTATAYIWLVWVKGMPPRAPFWIPPGVRARLSKPDDVERFTAHPVIKRERPTDAAGKALVHDEDGIIPDDASEVIARAYDIAYPEAPSESEPDANATGIGQEPAVTSAPCHVAAGSRDEEGDGLDIPAFLRRQAPEARP